MTPRASGGSKRRWSTGSRSPTQVLDASRAPFYRWFPDATLNTCFNALDRHVVHGHAERTALIYDSAYSGERRHFTYAELLEHVAAFAGALAAAGGRQG